MTDIYYDCIILSIFFDNDLIDLSREPLIANLKLYIFKKVLNINLVNDQLFQFCIINDIEKSSR